MTIYEMGARVEREACKNAVFRGALVSIRGAGSKSYSSKGFKIDTISIFPKHIEVTQHKKRGKIDKKDIINLLELQKLVPHNVQIFLGDTKGLKPIKECVSLIFK